MIGRKLIYKRDVFLFLIILTVAFSLIVWRYHTAGQSEKMAVLSYGGTETLSIPLWKDGIYEAESNGMNLHIEVKDGKAAFINSPCPDHTCEHFGWLEKEGDIAVCLPGAAILEISE